jgi:hypothetical protein
MTQESYTSSWQWTVDNSDYHFDYTRHDQPGEWFTQLGKYSGEWTQELETLMEASNPITWRSRKISPHYLNKDGTYEQSNMIDQEEADLENTGIDKNLVLTDVIEKEDLPPVFERMYKVFGLEDPWVRLHLQQPGQMFNLHIDKLYDRYPEDPSQVVRIVVNLTDWEPGQFYAYGTYNMSHWSSGDIHMFDWQNIPHATANCSRSIRPTMMMTGVKTKLTEEVLANTTPTSIYSI